MNPAAGYRRRTLWLVGLLFILSCAGRPVISDPRTIAVWEIDDLSPVSDRSQDLGEMLSARIAEELQKKEYFTIIERQRLLVVLEEQNLGASSLADESVRLRLGRLAGARYMVFGAYQIIAGMMRIDLRLVEVESGKIIKAVQKISSDTSLPSLFDTARKAAAEF